MITQLLLNYIAQDLAFFWSSIPSLPGGINNAITSIVQAEQWMSDHLAVVGIVIPWDEFSSLVTVALGVIAFWAAVQVIRVVLWVVNR